MLREVNKPTFFIATLWLATNTGRTSLFILLRAAGKQEAELFHGLVGVEVATLVGSACCLEVDINMNSGCFNDVGFVPT